MSISQPVRYAGEEFFRIDGTLADLQIAHTTINLLEQIQRESQQRNLIGGVLAPTTGMHGVVASSAALGLYDGEDMYNFAAAIDGKVVCGVFEDADKLVSGDSVSVVVSKRGEVLYVHSLYRKSDHLFLLPLGAMCGQAAFFHKCMRVAFRMTVLLWILLGAFSTIFHIVESPANPRYWLFALFSLLGPPLLMYPTELLSYRSMGPSGKYAEAIFQVNEIPKPDYFDASAGMEWFGKPGIGYLALNFSTALKKHKLRYKIKN